MRKKLLRFGHLGIGGGGWLFGRREGIGKGILRCEL